MDEILIEGKKYVSSKQAAKMTGYAKDYVGQLCREGRVPARLVGRGWYVLESAIADHRFGNQVELKGKEIIEETVPAVSKTWEFPRYEATPTEILPSINHLHVEEMTPVTTEKDQNDDDVEEEVAVEANQDVHDSWREWFDHVAEVESKVPISKIEVPISRDIENRATPEESKEVEKTKDIEVNVPLHVVSEYFPTKEIFLEDTPKTERKSGSRVVMRTIQIIGVLVAIISLSLACAGSGYLDAYLISNSQADVLLGVTVYNK